MHSLSIASSPAFRNDCRDLNLVWLAIIEYLMMCIFMCLDQIHRPPEEVITDPA